MKELAEISDFLSRSVEIILYIFQKFSFKKNIWAAEQFTWCTSKNKQGVLLKQKTSRFSHLLLLLLYTVYPFYFIIIQSLLGNE